jgi:hypothetical protein
MEVYIIGCRIYFALLDDEQYKVSLKGTKMKYCLAELEILIPQHPLMC